MIIKKKSLRSNTWLNKHFHDLYVKKSKIEKVRSRAWFKLSEIQNNHKILYPGAKVLDLGSSPGSWSQYAIKQIGDTGSIIACDIIPMKYIKGVTFIQGDFSSNYILNKLIKLTEKNKIQIILSDISPNISGHYIIDIPKCMYLLQLILDTCFYILSYNGSILMKIFQNNEFNNFIKKVNLLFEKVKICKPSASKSTSSEVYILAIGYKIKRN